jgi:profilin
MQEIVAGLSGKVDKLYAEGLHVAGERYVLTKAEDRSLYARKVRHTLSSTVIVADSCWILG